MGRFFCLFAVSGFCSLVYEIVWIRLAMAQFGVNTQVISLVLSVFMAGLGLGSWGAGRLSRGGGAGPPAAALRRYAAVELFIAAGGLAVPLLLSLGHDCLNRPGQSASWGSWSYFAASGACLAAAILPWSVAMGMTVPLAMSAMGGYFPRKAGRSFSYLYTANVLGATLGTLASAFLFVEWLGFRGTLALTAACNVIVAGLACAIGLKPGPPALERGPDESGPRSSFGEEGEVRRRERKILGMLFVSGCASMAMEVVWTRQFMPYIGTHVYSFAALLALYLLANNMGSLAYRRWGRDLKPAAAAAAWTSTGLLGVAALILADPYCPLPARSWGSGLRLFFSVVPFSAAVGFFTPMLVDLWSRGDPERAGLSYAVNILGCIAGPLLAGFVLLPAMSERWAVLILMLPFLVVGSPAAWRAPGNRAHVPARKATALRVGAAAAALLVLSGTRDFEDSFKDKEVYRDAAATVIATGDALDKSLVVNGVSVTILGQVTKWMAHMPLAFLPRPPRDALNICFGMGTTFRSLLSWGIPTTAVELVPSVPKTFGYFHSDGPELLKSPLSRVIVDDGRRFLERTREQFDVIAVDPAPPIEGAGAGLLYSREFYAVAKRRLRPGGILQQWHWRDRVDTAVLGALARAIREEFPYVRVFQLTSSGFCFLASESPISAVPAAELARRLPPGAVRDILEWVPRGMGAKRDFEHILSKEIAWEVLLSACPKGGPLRDDHPVNEYYLLRSLARILGGFGRS